MGSKGAINLSIGFVVVVVLAVLILSLGIMWIQGMFGSITGLTDQVIAKAKTQLMSDITSGKKDMGVTIPALTKVPPSGGGDLEIILKNKDFNARCYMFDIELVSVDSTVSSGYFNAPTCTGPGSACQGGDFNVIKQDAERWFLITPNIMSADAQATVSSTVTFDVTEGSKAGRYGFSAYGYFMNPLIAPAACKPGLDTTQLDPNKAPKVSSFQIEVSA